MQRRNTSARCLTCSRLIDQAAHSSSCPSDSSRPPHPRPKRSSLFSSLFSLSISVSVCLFHMHKNIREFRFQKKFRALWPAPHCRCRRRPSHFQQLAQPGGAAHQQQQQAAAQQSGQSVQSRLFAHPPSRSISAPPLLLLCASSACVPCDNFLFPFLIVCARVLGPVPTAAVRPAEFTCANPFVLISSISVWPIRFRDVSIVKMTLPLLPLSRRG